MDILEVVKKQMALNKALTEAVRAHLKSFEDETGVSVKSMYVPFVEVTQQDSVLTKYISANVQTELAFLRTYVPEGGER